MKFKIEDIRKELEDRGWKLLSEQYHNLDTELEMICPENHKVYLTYRKWRVYHECPVCSKNPLKSSEMKVIPRKSGTTRILALDQATNISGWAVFDDKELVQCGTFQSNQATAVEKIETVRQWVASMVEMWQPDRIAIEDIQLQQFGSKTGDNKEGVTTFKTLAHLQGVLINFFYINNLKYDIIHSATWRAYCDVKGRTRTDKKRSAQLLIKEWYDATVSQDEADAICIGKYEAEQNFHNNVMIEW